MTLARRRVVRVPASSANLGPGFDVMATALALHLELEVVETGTFAVTTSLPVPRDRSNLLVRAFERLAPADAFKFRIASEIPLSGGLGSSAAAIVAGLTAADHLFELDADVAALATELEAVLVVPGEPVRTALARAALPESVPIADAVANVASASTLTLGLATGDWELIAAGLRDRLHQPYRAHLYPRSAALRDRARELGALGATISGAGPTVLVWCRADQTGPVVQALRRECDGWADVIRAPFTQSGVDVTF